MTAEVNFEIPSGVEHNSETAKRARMEFFSEWLVTPPAHRVPSTQKELADMIGVSEWTLTQYKKDKVFQAMIVARAREAFGAQRLVDVIDSLYQIALGDAKTAAVQAAKTLLGWYQDTHSDVPMELAHLSDEELATLAQRDE